MRQGLVLSTEARTSLVAPISYAEIDAATNSINDAKAPSIDGFNAFFPNMFGQTCLAKH